MCGDQVNVKIFVDQGLIKNISAKVRGCALCEASAGLVVKLFKNKEMPSEKLSEEFQSWLNSSDQEIPKTLPIEMDVFRPIKEIKNRHKCITMPFEATVKSVKR